MGGAPAVARILVLRTMASHPLWAARRLGGCGGRRLRRHLRRDLAARPGGGRPAVCGTHVCRATVFDAMTSDREFTVIMSDYALTVLGGPLLCLLEQRAPNVRLRIQPTDRSAVDEAAATLRGADLIVLPRGYFTDLPSAELYRDRWVAVCAADNALMDAPTLTAEHLSSLHWIVSYDAPTQYTPPDKHLRFAGVERRVDVVVQNILALPFLLAGTNRVAIMQQRLADKLRIAGGIRVLELPLAVPELIGAASWHPSRSTEPGQR